MMGSLQGRVRGREIIIMDSFELPVEGTETRVSAANEGYEYMVQYMTMAEEVSRYTQKSKTYLSLGWAARECHWLVPFSSWLRMLALWN